LIKVLKEIIDIRNDKFYHLITTYLKSGYYIKVKKKSRSISAVSIKLIEKNTSKFQVYQGTMLAPIFSNLLSNQILNEINSLIKKNF